MTFSQAIQSGFAHYIDFEGRTSRSGYWYWVLFAILVSLAAQMLDTGVMGIYDRMGPFYTIAALTMFLPNLAIAVRRLHDIDRSGWWFLIVFTGIGAFLLLYWYCQKSDDGINRYGAPEGGMLAIGKS